MKTKSEAEKYFDQAADTFLNAFKTCVRLQEQAANQCFTLVKKWGDGEDWKKTCQEVGEQAMPQMKKAADESLKFWEENTKKCMDLLGEGFSAARNPSFDDAQAKLRKQWEESLAAMRENTETMVKLSGDALQAYVDFMKKQAEAAPKAAAK